MIQRPRQKQLSDAAKKAITEASAEQTGQVTKIRSYDPNYPVFEVPVCQKVLIYIPNHTVMEPDGSVQLRMDKFAAHAGIDGRSFVDIRCTQGVVVDELGLDGTCPLCNAMNEVWDLYNKEYADVAKSRGIDPQSPEAKDLLAEDRKKLINAMAVKNPDVWYSYPIVVIDCIEKDGQLTVIPKKDAEQRITGTPMWYSIRERTYLDKWGAAFDSIEVEDGDVPTSPAGRWAVLNFVYSPKSGKPDKMGSARNLTVAFKQMPGYEQWATYFDQLTEDWTPEKAQEVLVLDAVRDMEEMNQVTDTLMKPVRDKLAMYALSSGTGVEASGAIASGSSNAEQALSAFGGGAPVQTDGAGAPPAGNLTAEMPQSGVTTE